MPVIHESVEVATLPADKKLRAGAETAGIGLDGFKRAEVKATILDSGSGRRRDPALSCGKRESPAVPASDRAQSKTGATCVHHSMIGGRAHRRLNWAFAADCRRSGA